MVMQSNCWETNLESDSRKQAMRSRFMCRDGMSFRRESPDLELEDRGKNGERRWVDDSLTDSKLSNIITLFTHFIIIVTVSLFN